MLAVLLVVRVRIRVARRRLLAGILVGRSRRLLRHAIGRRSIGLLAIRDLLVWLLAIGLGLSAVGCRSVWSTIGLWRVRLAPFRNGRLRCRVLL